MQTGQNSIVPENSLPQLGQVCLDSALMVLTVLQPKETPRSTEWCEIGRPLANYCPVPQAIACSFILACQMIFRKKIPAAPVLRHPLLTLLITTFDERRSRLRLQPSTFDVAINRVVVRRYSLL